MSRSDRTFLTLLAVPLACAVVFSWTRLVLELDDVPRDEDYERARALLVRDGFVGGADALAILPPWSLRPLAQLADRDPISGDALASQPFERYRRLFVLVEPDPGPELAALLERLGPPAGRDEAGRVEVLRFDLPAPTVVFDLRARLGEAQVRIVTPTGEVLCTARAARDAGFTCPARPAWQRVTRAWHLVSENADDVVWSHPPPRGERLEIAWDNVPLGGPGGGALVVRAGHLREGADSARAAVRVTVTVDGAPVSTIERRPAFDFRVERVDLSRFAGRRARLALVIESDNEASNHFAWDAMVVDASSEVSR